MTNNLKLSFPFPFDPCTAWNVGRSYDKSFRVQSDISYSESRSRSDPLRKSYFLVPPYQALQYRATLVFQSFVVKHKSFPSMYSQSYNEHSMRPHKAMEFEKIRDELRISDFFISRLLKSNIKVNGCHSNALAIATSCFHTPLINSDVMLDDSGLILKNALKNVPYTSCMESTYRFTHYQSGILPINLLKSIAFPFETSSCLYPITLFYTLYYTVFVRWSIITRKRYRKAKFIIANTTNLIEIDIILFY
ncbi:hypothetical protein V1477_021190 [Vespula maculifrons]|uniref:Uncharacterized protein n=1 Tax=Vespula maculifrons TaxID=7453 RepID=A0ABD2AGD6_VESMC